MSKIGKKNISIPDNVSFSKKNDLLIVEGSLGKEEIQIPSYLQISIQDSFISISPQDNVSNVKVQWGLYRSLINNAVIGVSQGFTTHLQLIGVGYKVNKVNDDLEFNLGYSHSIKFPSVKGITYSVSSNVVSVSGINKQLVGQVTQSIIDLRKRDIYKGKGIYFKDQIIRKKQVKK